MNMNVSKEILDFLTGIHSSENRKKEMFDNAFKLAYKDMATHTVSYKKDAKDKYFYNENKICNENRETVKTCIKSFVENKIFGGNDLNEFKNNLNGNDFDIWHENACTLFSKFNGKVNLQSKDKGEKTESLGDLIKHECANVFTIGQAQKLINMMIKYLYIYNKCEEENERVLKSEDLKNIEDHAHAAIDDNVLKEVFKDKYKYTKWSRLQKYAEEGDEDTYCKYKKRIDKAKDETMFLWELKNWPFNKD